MPKLEPRNNAGRKPDSQKRTPAPDRTKSTDMLAQDKLVQLTNGNDFSRDTFERHAALLSDPLMSQPMYAKQRAEVVRQIQRDYGNRYVQGLVGHVQRSRSDSDEINASAPNASTPTIHKQGHLAPTFHVSARIPKGKVSDSAQNERDQAQSSMDSQNSPSTSLALLDSASGGGDDYQMEVEPGMATLVVTDSIATSIPYNPSINETATPPGDNEFGLTKWTSRVTDLEVDHDADINAYLVTANVECPITWSVHDIGRTDILSDTDGDISGDNYGTVASDLTPDMASDGGRPPRTQFWASDLTEQHEKYHANDFAYVYGTPAFEAAITWLKAQTADSEAEARTHANAIPNRMMQNLIANYVPGSETRAYGDGAPSYKGRSDSIKAKGDKGDYS